MDQLEILWGVILASAGVIGGLSLVIPPEAGPADPTVILVLGGLGMSGPMLSLAWGRVVAAHMTGPARWLPRWALAETGACCALVNHLAGGPAAITWATTGVAVLVIAAQFPRENG